MFPHRLHSISNNSRLFVHGSMRDSAHCSQQPKYHSAADEETPAGISVANSETVGDEPNEAISSDER
jgi:hypothetical protein